MAATDGSGEDVRVAVLGTGIMGSAMARNLVSAGLRTTAWDRSPELTAPLSDAGALAAASPAEAVQDAQVVITMLPTADVVNSVIFDNGVAEALAEGAAWAQMGTIGLAETAGIASRLGRLRSDVMFVDAPVSGSKGPAEAGRCSSWHLARLRRPQSWARCSPRSAARPCGWARPARAAG